jgi:hypothetical protein
MPRQLIRGPVPTAPHPEMPVPRQHGAEVSWGRGLTVSIGTVPLDEPTKGTHVVLDESSLDQLIRTLRRARKQVYP